MKYSRKQPVKCPLFGDEYYIILATKEEPYYFAATNSNVEVPDGFDYLIAKYARIDEDNLPFFIGSIPINEEQLDSVNSQYYQEFVQSERAKKAARA